MNDAITLLFGEDPGDAGRQRLQQDLLDLKEVAETGLDDTRAPGVVDLALWVGFVADALAIGTVAAAVIGKIVERVRRQGIRNAVIELPNGVNIAVDSATPEQIASLVSAWKEEQARSKRRTKRS